ncbi:MAG: PaaI family thioesterase [Pseudomonadota bacterium]|nr:PaaI family thioesterase [Pseudomonadota bacterium]
MEPDPERQKIEALLREKARTATGQTRALGFEFVSAHPRGAVIRLPWREDLVGNPETRVLHGGVITTLVDSVCGWSLFSALGGEADIATLDLRIDYLHPAEPDRDVFARGEVYKMTRSIAFLRAVAYQDEDEPIANCVATFMVGANTPKLQARGAAQ